MKGFIFLVSFLFSSGFLLGQEDNSGIIRSAVYDCSNPAPIDSRKIKHKKNQLYIQFERSKGKKKKSKVFSKDNEAYFTGYLINTTDSLVEIQKQDGSLIMIQEALNEEGEWQPIEYWKYSWCGNSYFYPLKLNAKQFVSFQVKEYCGDFKTSIRLKLKNKKDIIYSKPYKANIDRSLFEQVAKSKVKYDKMATYLDDNYQL